MNIGLRIVIALAVFGGVALFILTFEHPPIEITQNGYRGTAMEQVHTAKALAATRAANTVPAALPAAPAGGPAASTVYKNVQVLGDLSSGEFTRLMLAITQWVSPEQGCAYCHEGANFASDGLYTKVVARRMLQMTRNINAEWKSHVADTGVTCYTCHRGKPVPANIWFTDPGPKRAMGPAGNKAGQNMPAKSVGLASLPYDPFTSLLTKPAPIRVLSTTALPTGQNPHNIMDTEHTYALMVHMSEGLGVNCTFCHNTRSFGEWKQSTPQRVTAYHGIQMARALNVNYLAPLKTVFPPNRLGPLGDAPKLNCSTCHQGVNKPLYGVSMLPDYPGLAGFHDSKQGEMKQSAMK